MHRTQLLHSKLIHDAFIMYLDLESLSIGFGELDGDCSDKAVRLSLTPNILATSPSL